MENQYYIIRTERAGVFAGNIKERNGNEATLTDVRRLWYWHGAASLSQLANPALMEFLMGFPIGWSETTA